MLEKGQAFIMDTTVRLAHGEAYYVIVPDNCAGKRRRFTLYRCPSSPHVGKHGGVVVLGRELPPGLCRKIADEDYKKGAK